MFVVITQQHNSKSPTFTAKITASNAFVSSAICSDKDFKALKKVGMIFGSPMTEILEVKNIKLVALECLPINSRKLAQEARKKNVLLLSLQFVALAT